MIKRLVLLAGLSVATAALAQAPGTLRVVNRTSGYITVNIDGKYGCNTSAGSTCTIPVAQGHRDLTAQRSDNGQRIAAEANVGAEPYVWTPWED